MEYEPIRAFFKGLSLYLEARIRIRILIKVKDRIRILNQPFIVYRIVLCSLFYEDFSALQHAGPEAPRIQ